MGSVEEPGEHAPSARERGDGGPHNCLHFSTMCFIVLFLPRCFGSAKRMNRFRNTSSSSCSVVSWPLLVAVAREDVVQYI